MHLKEIIKKKIPAKYLYTLVNLKKSFQINGFSVKSFSGSAEDLLLKESIFKNKKDGFFVDVGAFHPKHLSNTHLLHKQGWTGINIDPNPESIALFEKNRPKDINILCGVSDTEKPLTYYSFSHSGVNTFSKEHAEEKQSKSWNQLLDTKEIMCYPLKKILDEHVPKNKVIDLLDVDVEGVDLKVLQSNDWEKYKPRVILVEDSDFKEKLGESEIYTFLKNKGYTFHSYVDITLIMKSEVF